MAFIFAVIIPSSHLSPVLLPLVIYSYEQDRPPCELFRLPRPESFPHNGKTFRHFSTQWKECFHGVENSDFRLFSGGSGCSLGAVERSTRRPLSTVERDRPRGREKRCPMQSGSALSRSRLGCGVGRDHFSGREVGGFSRSQVRRGRCARSDLQRGLLIIPRGLRDNAAECRQARPQDRTRLARSGRCRARS